MYSARAYSMCAAPKATENHMRIPAKFAADMAEKNAAACTLDSFERTEIQGGSDGPVNRRSRCSYL